MEKFLFIFKKKAKQKKLIRFMKCCLIFIILGIGSCFANETYSQRTFFTFEYKNRAVKEIIREIEQSSEYIFFYMDNSVNVNRKVSVKVDNERVEKVLDQLFSGTRNQYYVSDRQIIISSAKAPEPVNTAPVVQQQSRTITGVVRDASGPVIGANVLVRGTTNGDVTNIDGQFTISNVPANAVLQISFIGYISQEVSVGNRTQFDIIIQEDIEALEEVVVVGYGTLRKKDVTGSVGQVSTSTLENQVVRNIDQALTGQIAGVQVISKSGMPGEAPMIRIRGVGSITAESTPLYVVDGFPSSDIRTLNPADIESLDILKDASATAIYGSRGSNGVIIINTKRGVAGKPTISADISYGISKVAYIPPMMNGPELAQYAYDALKNRNLDEGRDISNPDPTQWYRPLPEPMWNVVNGSHVVDCDMVREILRTAPEMSYKVSVNGGNESVRYLLSAEYLDQEGVVRNSNFDRLSIRANLDVKLSKRANLKFNLNPTFMNENLQNESGSGSYGNYMSSSPVNNAQLWPSYYPARGIFEEGTYELIREDKNGEYYMFDQNWSSHEWNPLARANETLDNRKSVRVFTNMSLDFNILDELRFNIMAGGTLSAMNEISFTPQLWAFQSGGSLNQATGRDDSEFRYNWSTEYTLHYNKIFGKHSIIGLAGFTAEASWSKSSYLTSNLYPNNLIPYLSAVAGALTNGTATLNETSLISYLTRINYNYDSKYYITASWRRDGSSRFGANKKYGNFPSVSVAWRVSGENFMKDVTFINDLKLRASWGRNGNNSIGNYRNIATIEYLRYILGNSLVQGYSPARLDNPDLTWETQTQTNGGLDLSILNNRLTFTFEYYFSKNTDLLLDVNIPSTTGFTRTMKNIGEVQNKGFDVNVTTVNIKNKGISWTTNFNISHYKNRVNKLGPEGDPIYPPSGMTGGYNITQIGSPVGMFFGFLTDGIFKNQAEVDKGPIVTPGTSTASRPGDVRYVDINGDGIIDNDDITVMGDPYPKFTYGMTNNVSWKNLTLSLSFYGSYGNEIINAAAVGTMNMRGNRVGQTATQLNYWKSEQEPGDGKAPRPNDVPTGGNRNTSQRYLEPGSFMRINNVRLNYAIPAKSLRDLTNVSSLQASVYVNVSNLYTFTDNVMCFNPDVSNSRSALNPGISFSDYPLPRTFVFGLNIKF